MIYRIQKGDSISKITDMLGINWDEFRKLNPHAVNQSKTTGKWYIKAGKTVEVPESFKVKLTAAQDDMKVEARRQETGGNQWREYIVQRGDSIWKLSREKFNLPVDAIMKDNNIVNAKSLQIGQSLRIRNESFSLAMPANSPPPGKEEVVASWYGEKYHGRLMSNGKPFDMYKNTIAHRDLPLGTRVEIENPATGKVVEATVTDRGPFIPGRDIDLSYGLARQLSMVEKGVGKLLMRVL